MATLLVTHPACLEHSNGPGHPESPARLTAVLKALEAPAFAGIARREGPEPAPDVFTRVHDEAYVKAIFAAVPREGWRPLDPDTGLSPGSGRAALGAAGAVAAAVDAVVAGEAANAFCPIRPPGHHAEVATPMGFCLFNNVAIAALHARVAHGVQRVAVLDFDVHHGNGTQQRFAADPDLFFASTHQTPFYPGTGRREDRGIAGNIVNRPMPAGTDGDALRAVWSDEILPALDAFAPEFVLISAGFDGHAADPLGGFRLVEDDFAWLTREIAERAAIHAGGRLVSVLEGGYHLPALAASVCAHVAALMAAGA